MSAAPGTTWRFTVHGTPRTKRGAAPGRSGKGGKGRHMHSSTVTETYEMQVAGTCALYSGALTIEKRLTLLDGASLKTRTTGTGTVTLLDGSEVDAQGTGTTDATDVRPLVAIKRPHKHLLRDLAYRAALLHEAQQEQVLNLFFLRGCNGEQRNGFWNDARCIEVHQELAQLLIHARFVGRINRCQCGRSAGGGRSR